MLTQYACMMKYKYLPYAIHFMYAKAHRQVKNDGDGHPHRRRIVDTCIGQYTCLHVMHFMPMPLLLVMPHTQQAFQLVTLRSD
jgi:hypothetical protein